MLQICGGLLLEPNSGGIVLNGKNNVTYTFFNICGGDRNFGARKSVSHFHVYAGHVI
jgi:hypothetical protein